MEIEKRQLNGRVQSAARSVRADTEGFDHQTFAAVPTPLIFLEALVIGVGLNFLWPNPIFTEARSGDVLGLLATLGSAAIAFWAFRTMLRAGEQPDPGVPTRTIVREGPFDRTRNPIYLSFALFDIGAALLLNNLWVAIAIAAFMIYVDMRVIRREESYLEHQFADEYLDY